MCRLVRFSASEALQKKYRIAPEADPVKCLIKKAAAVVFPPPGLARMRSVEETEVVRTSFKPVSAKSHLQEPSMYSERCFARSSETFEGDSQRLISFRMSTDRLSWCSQLLDLVYSHCRWISSASRAFFASSMFAALATMSISVQ